MRMTIYMTIVWCALQAGFGAGQQSLLSNATESKGVVMQDMTGMLLGQNLPRYLPNSNSSRVLVAAWIVFALILGLAYRGNLTASLTIPKFPPRPETLEQLVHAVDRYVRYCNSNSDDNYISFSHMILLASFEFFGK